MCIRDGEPGPRGKGQSGKRGDRCISLGRPCIPTDIVDLLPFVGTHDDDVVAIGDVGDQLVLGHDHTEPVDSSHRGHDHGQPLVEGRLRDPVLPESRQRNGKIDPIESVDRTGGQGDLHVCDRRGIERSRIHTESPGGRRSHMGTLPWSVEPDILVAVNVATSHQLVGVPG